MSKKVILGESCIKFYNATTGEEILPMSEEELKVSFQRGKEKEESLKELREQTGYYFPELCPSCGQYYEGYDGHYELDGDVKCRHCIRSDERLNLPFFAPEIPNYVEGATRRMFTFTDANDLYEKIKSRLCNGDILVKSDKCIMSQSLTKQDWRVFGYINNFDMGLLNIPTFDSNVYDDAKFIENEKISKWLNGKDIIKGSNHEN